MVSSTSFGVTNILYREGAITRETALAYAFDPEQMARRLSM